MKPETLETEYVILNIEFGLHELNMQGREGYRSGVRPNHWIPGRDYAFAGQVDFCDRELLKPGESCKATAKCFMAAQDVPSLKPGFAWHVCEANRIVGYARVL